MADNKQTIRAFILDRTPIVALADDESVFAGGLVSSMFVMQLVMFVEKTFGLTIEGDDLTFEHFQTVNAIDALVSRKTAAAKERGNVAAER